MTEQTIIALIGAIIAIILAGIGYLVAAMVRLNRRLRKLEHRDRLSWLYIRVLINHAYVHNALPLPDPPPGWLEDPDD